jgi:pyocin large subunit-like protein
MTVTGNLDSLSKPADEYVERVKKFCNDNKPKKTTPKPKGK